MTTTQRLAIILLVPFTVLSLYAVSEVGYVGIFTYHLHSPAGWQVFTDLVIALILVLNWLIPHARAAGRNPWPWVVLTLTLGSIGPLIYLAIYGAGRKNAHRVDEQSMNLE